MFLATVVFWVECLTCRQFVWCGLSSGVWWGWPARGRTAPGRGPGVVGNTGRGRACGVYGLIRAVMVLDVGWSGGGREAGVQGRAKGWTRCVHPLGPRRGGGLWFQTLSSS